MNNPMGGIKYRTLWIIAGLVVTALITISVFKILWSTLELATFVGVILWMFLHLGVASSQPNGTRRSWGNDDSRAGYAVRAAPSR